VFVVKQFRLVHPAGMCSCVCVCVGDAAETLAEVKVIAWQGFTSAGGISGISDGEKLIF